MMAAEEGGELVSVLVPAYNAAATVAETLRSAIAQTYPRIEVIVVDDGSTDATAEVVASLADRDARIRLFRQQNAGVSAARNLAIEKARGSYLAPLDADDVWHAEKIARQMTAMRRGGPQLGVVYCWWRRIDLQSRVLGEEWRPYAHQGDVYAALIMGNPLGCGSTSLMRRACVAEVGGYDAKFSLCEDLELYLRLAERYDFALVPQYLVGYRHTPGSASSNPRSMVDSQGLALAEARRRHSELPLRLFRIAEARSAYQRGPECLRSGMWRPGLTLLWNALRQDPLGAAYRIAEPLHRLGVTRSYQLHGLAARAIGDPTTPSSDPANSAGERSTSSSGGRRSDRLRGRPFFSVSPEPRPDAPLGSTLYGWRCATIAASLAGRTRRG